MGTLTGLPDFGRPERYGVVSGYAAFERPGVVAAVATGLSPAPVEGSEHPLVVDRYLQERDGGVESFAIVTAGFALDVPLDTAHPHDRHHDRHDDRPHVVARPAPLANGVVRLMGPASLGFPDGGFAPQPFDAAAGRVLPTLVRLDGVAGDLLVGALQSGLMALGAVAWVTVRGVATRCPGSLEVDVDALLAGLGSGVLTEEVLGDGAADGLPGVSVTGGPDDARVRAAAVLDRLVVRLGAPSFEADDLEGGWRFPEAWGGQATLSWDLSAPAPAHRLLRLACDPLVGEAGPDVVRDHEAPALTDGRETVLVHTTVPAGTAGLAAVSVRLVAPPAPPARPFEAEASGLLEPPAPTVLTLVLAPGEKLAYDLAATAVLETDAGSRASSGAVRRVDGDSTPVVAAADLGLRLIPVNATDDLLTVADVSVVARARVSDEVVVTRAHLRKGPPRTWLALPRDAEDVSLEAEATSRQRRPAVVSQALPVAAVWLDLFSFDDPPWPLPGEAADDPVVVEAAGLRVVGRPAQADWRFLPLTAGAVRDESGAAQLTLLEMAGTATLMVTTALLVSDAQQEQAKAACVAAGAPADVRLSPAPFEAEEAALLVLRGDALATLATTTPSGTATQDAAFGVGLGPEDLDTVHRALAGQAGLLVVRYVLSISASGPEAAALAGEGGPVTVTGDASTWRT